MQFNSKDILTLYKQKPLRILFDGFYGVTGTFLSLFVDGGYQHYFKTYNIFLLIFLRIIWLIICLAVYRWQRSQDNLEHFAYIFYHPKYHIINIFLGLNFLWGLFPVGAVLQFFLWGFLALVKLAQFKGGVPEPNILLIFYVSCVPTLYQLKALSESKK